jgi:predicted phosphodiesterase
VAAFRTPLTGRAKVVIHTIAAVLVCVVAAASALYVVSSYDAKRSLSVGTVRLSVDPLGEGLLDIYVPKLDSGTRFQALQAPANLNVNVESINEAQVTHLVTHPALDQSLRHEAEYAISSFLENLFLWAGLAALGGGLCASLVLKLMLAQGVPRLRYLAGISVLAAVATVAAMFVVLPPRGALANPQYYSREQNLSVAFSRAIKLPPGVQRITVASDLHDNLKALPALGQAAQGLPVFFPGDLTSGGTPFEGHVTNDVARSGHPFVYVSGNHDSDVLDRSLARTGAVVLTQRGRLLPDGRFAEMVTNVDGLRVAGYSDPAERTSADHYATKSPDPVPASVQQAFWSWLSPLVGHVDVVLVHNPAVADLAVARLRSHPPPTPLLLLTGHTHVKDLQTSENLTEVNAGTVGAGGIGDVEGRPHQRYGLAVVGFARTPRPYPLLLDQVTFDPLQGSVNSQQTRLKNTAPGALPVQAPS